MSTLITAILFTANILFAIWGWSTEHYFTASLNTLATLVLGYMLISEGRK